VYTQWYGKVAQSLMQRHFATVCCRITWQRQPIKDVSAQDTITTLFGPVASLRDYCERRFSVGQVGGWQLQKMANELISCTTVHRN